MKTNKLLVVFLFLFNISLASQTYYKYEGTPLSENDNRMYNNTIETDDNNVIVFEKYYKDGYFSGAVEMLKFNQKAELLDSAFIDFKNISSYSPLIKNPFENDSYVLGGFYLNENDNLYHYNAIFINGDLEVTNEIDVKIPYNDISLKNYRIHFVKNEFLVWCSYKEYTDMVTYMRMDIYGNVLSYQHYDSFELEEMCSTNNPFFVISENPLQYGVVYYKVDDYNNGWTASYGTKLIAVLNENLFTVDIKHIEQFENYKFRSTKETHVISLDEGEFIMASSAFVYYGTDVCVTLTKFDKDFNIIDSYTTPHYNIGTYGVYVNDSPCIEKSESGGVHLLWGVKDNGNNSMYSSYSYYLDSNLDLKWECKYDESQYNGPFIYDMHALKNGGLVLVGWDMHTNKSCCYIISNDGTSVSEYSNNNRPYSFYPNPANDVINIHYSLNVNVEKVEIYGMDGKMYHEQNFNLETISVNSLSNGIYMMKVVLDNGETFNDKIVVK